MSRDTEHPSSGREAKDHELVAAQVREAIAQGSRHL